MTVGPFIPASAFRSPDVHSWQLSYSLQRLECRIGSAYSSMIFPGIAVVCRRRSAVHVPASLQPSPLGEAGLLARKMVVSQWPGSSVDCANLKQTWTTYRQTKHISLTCSLNTTGSQKMKVSMNTLHVCSCIKFITYNLSRRYSHVLCLHHHVHEWIIKSAITFNIVVLTDCP